MKSKLIIVLLIGMLIGVFMGGILTPAIVATEYNYQLDEISSYLSTIAYDVNSIANDVDTVETYIKRIYRNMP